MADRPAPEPEADEFDDSGGEGQRSAVPDELGAQPTGADAAKPNPGEDGDEPDGRAY